MAELRTPAEVIDALGGNAKVARILNCNPKAVANWRTFQRLPCKTFIAIRMALAEQGDTAPLSLWGMILTEQPPPDKGTTPSRAA